MTPTDPPLPSRADHSVSPPLVDIPRRYNAAVDLIERNLLEGRGDKIAYIDDLGQYTYAELAQRVNRAASVLRGLGLEMEQRVMLAHLDTVDFPAVFLGAIRAGIVPVAANTLLTTADYRFMLEDNRARALVVSEQLLPAFAPLLEASPFLEHVIVSGKEGHGHLHLQTLLREAGGTFAPAPTTRDDVCFWLYSSGSTGTPKGTVHIHSSLIQTAELYAKPILGIRQSDVVFSAAKLFFAYGLGNALTFPLAVGATAVLMAQRPTPAVVFDCLTRHRPTIFYGVPTLYGAMLAHAELPAREKVALRACTSAGEALPAEIGRRWKSHFGVDILDGIGSTEMLHIFLSNRPGEVRYGTTGKPVPGYEIRLLDEHGREVGIGEMGDLHICGPTSATHYWNNRERSLATFVGPWTKAGDKYSRDEAGYYTYGGRSDDMLKVSGMYVSPFEVEAALVTHDTVLEVAVVGWQDEQQLIKPKAFVVLKAGVTGSAHLADALKQHVKDRLAPYKYPRWIEFVGELPKTATGKIQRFKLRQQIDGAPSKA
ncbi:MAG TPA: benzoate-CoA ligase family protein [Burkholderiales bacterium]|nr:benzoate-CoA ligase family protein [Burkholderiales bacterium]